MNRILLFFIIVMLYTTYVFAEESVHAVAITTVVSPQVELGSHLNSVGIRAAFKYERIFDRLDAGMFVESASRFDITCLSIPGSQHQVSFFICRTFYLGAPG